MRPNCNHYLVYLTLALLISGCSKQEKAAAGGPAPSVPVTIATVEQKDVPVTIRAIGNVEPIEKVEIKSQIAGQVMAVHFKEGQDVEKGDLLFEIDPRQQQADLNKAQGQLLRDQAEAANAKAQAERYKRLFEEGVTSKQEYDRIVTTAQSADATVEADKAAVETARVQLQYTKIYSPVSGRTGNLTVTRGNVVKANEATLVTINQIHPIYVTFSIPEQQFPDVKRYMLAGLQVEAFPQGASDPQGTRGKVTFIDNAVDVATGTIKLKATFENPKNTLWPGQFADVVLTLTTQPNAITVPSAAVNVGQNGQYVFVVNDDKQVEMRPVNVQRTFGEQSIITQGLKPGEKVVTDGQLRLTNGSTVEIKGTYKPPQQIPGIAGGSLPTTPTVPNTSLPAPSNTGGNTGASRQ